MYEQTALDKGYRVDELGNVFDKKGQKVHLRPDNRSKTGYLYFRFKIKGFKNDSRCYVHRLIAFLKFGDALFKPGIVTRHKDNYSLNNRWENILIGTQKENMADIPPGAHGSRTHGIKYVMVASQANLRYEWKDVLEHHKQSGSYVKTMKAFGIRSKSTMSNIVNRSKAGMIRSLTPGMAGSPAQ